MTFNKFKFTEEELASKSVIALEDRPNLSAAEMKARLDSGDIRERFNQAMDALQKERKRLFVMDSLNDAALAEINESNADGTRFFAIFLDTGETFFGDLAQLRERVEA